jgi:hypothetical protein
MPFSKDVQADGLFTDCVDEGHAFQLLDARPGGERETKHGRTRTTQLLITTPSGPKWLSIIGEAVEREVAGLVPADFPAWCVVERVPTKTPGQEVKLLRPAQAGDPEATVSNPASANAGPASQGYGNVPS